jgi:hypothetical protein
VTATLISILIGAAPAAGQMIPVKTVPVAAGNQFAIFPSDNPGLGGLSIAVNDRALDPFVHPAKGARLEGGQVAGSPGFYAISDDNGGARTLPISAEFGGTTWFVGGAAAFQELDLGRPDDFFFDPSGSPLSRSSATNVYLSSFAGARLNDSGLSIGGSVYWAGLDGLDGVKLLYTPGSTVDQAGSMVDLRAGLVQDWQDGGQGELLVIHNRFSMTHDVRETLWLPWTDPVIDPMAPDPLPGPVSVVRTEGDETTTWGAHFGYQRPVGERGWRVGGILTGNWKHHPKIPDYDIMNIPRDPGDSWAYNLGAGVAYVAGGTTFGVDLVYEPIWSDTWVEAEERLETASGRVIEAGDRTLENDFRFSNASLRTGIGRDAEHWGAQLGLQVRSYSYELEQKDLVFETFREQHEDWLEWTPTWALVVRFEDLSLQYAGSLTSGGGRPGTSFAVAGAWPEADVGTNFLAAPDGPLTLQEALVHTHRISVAVPLG